ncbi:MAG: hypothetical protein IT246_09355 [Bacteroidia bacterium]|nr:hypothetical protein [Bacteroidia bacterium]
MKKNNFLLILTVTILISYQYTFAQTELFGNWKVNCPFELTDKSSTTVCNLCPIVKRDVGYTVKGFEMKIEENEIEFNMDKKSRTKYKWDDVSKSIEFDYNGINYQFKVLIASYGTEEHYILKNKDGLLVFLDKKK